MCLRSPCASLGSPLLSFTISIMPFPAPVLYLSLGCIFPLITPSYPSSSHHFPSRRTSVFFICDLSANPSVIVARSVHTGNAGGRERAHKCVCTQAHSRGFACINVQIHARRQYKHTSTHAEALSVAEWFSPAQQHIAYVKSHSPYQWNAAMRC